MGGIVTAWPISIHGYMGVCVCTIDVHVHGDIALYIHGV